MTPRAILWDYGNTLATLDFEAMAALVGDRVTADDLRAVEGAHRRALDEHLRVAIRTGVASGTLRFLLDDLFARNGVTLRPGARDAIIAENRRWSLWRIANPEAPAVLATLAELGVRQAVVSNGDGRVAEHLRKQGILDRFEVVIDSAVVGHSKPDPEIFATCLAAMHLQPRDAAYVGDLPAVDVLGAGRAGLTPILYDPLGSFDGTECLGHQACVIRTLAALPSMVSLCPPSST